MKPTVETLHAACPDVDVEFIRAHLARLDDRYFARFDLDHLSQHLEGIARLSPERPVETLLCQNADGTIECTVLAFDYPYEFSLITGALAGVGFSIRSGDVFTYRPAPAQPAPRTSHKRRRGRLPSQAPLKQRRIIDHFVGTVESPLPFDRWAAWLKELLAEVIGLMARGDEDALSRARLKVHELVAGRLAGSHVDARAVLYPVEIDVDNATGPFTRLRVVSEDTPAFLYALTNALALRNIRIERVAILTIDQRVEDEIDVVDARGRRIEDPERLNELKLSVLLTKQFTYFLSNAPDPYAALCRFEQLVDKTLQAPSRGQWLDVLSNPHALQELARLLGTSDFLWEDFIRLQYETLLPMLAPHVEGRRFSEPAETIGSRLAEAIEGADTFEEKRERFNQFKDREIFLIDLDHIVGAGVDFRALAERLTRLAEHAVSTAVGIVFAHLARRHGIPRTAAGTEAKYAVMGLGKFGGAALGYASDIELLFAYSDNGRTDGEEPVDNGEFFHRLAQETSRFIQAKREGIFQVDLRLRPYGSASPLATSLENFCRYYGPGGPALSYERLALVRLRAVAGDAELGAQIERLRDEFVYAAGSIDCAEIRELRRKQYEEKTRGGLLNVKFSPGGLVDVEYDVQILQVMHGSEQPGLRTPRIREALSALAGAGVLSPEEGKRLTAAYDFLRRLINGMRMLRGSAKDLFLPPDDSDEFTHLARRIGYKPVDGFGPARQLNLDFEAYTAAVRAFVERHFGRESLPSPSAGTVADVVLSEGLPDELRDRILINAGFQDSARAYDNLRRLAGDGQSREMFMRLAILACDTLRRKPDPDMALNNWERFVSSLASREGHFSRLLSQPVRLEILLSLFSGSQFLANTLARNPEFFDWVTTPAIVQALRDRGEFEKELRDCLCAAAGHDEWRNQIRILRRREILRIGTRDMWLGAPIHETVGELSRVAEAVTDVALEGCWQLIKREIKRFEGIDDPARHFCILAFGKLGGNELNYSSDIDLLGLSDDVDFTVHLNNGKELSPKELYSRVLERVRADLSDHTEEGYAYRVDFRLRPYGDAGELVSTVQSLVNYYNGKASLWELQAALKLRPIAGSVLVGQYFLNLLRPALLHQRPRREIVDSVLKMRDSSIRKRGVTSRTGPDIKSGVGGIRDIEFLVQALQMINGPAHPELLGGNTLHALDALKKCDVIPPALAEQLANDYAFLRRVEHFLQILEDRQVHALPRDETELSALAKRTLGIDATAEQFMKETDACLKRVRSAFAEL